MKKTEVKKQIKNIETTTYFCDKCRKEIKNEDYNAFDCTVKLTVGENCCYNGSFNGDNYRVDLCEACARLLFFEILPKSKINITNTFDELFQ